MGSREGWLDVSTARDGSLVKRVIEKGESGRIPLNAHVIVHMENRLNDASGNILHSSRIKQIPLEFCVGKGIGLRGMQQAVSCMEGEERAHILMEPQWAYGPKGMPPLVPPNSKIFVDLEILAFEECDLMSIMGEDDEVVKLRLEARITQKHMHVVLTDKTLLYGPNKGKKNQFVTHKLPNKEDVTIDQSGPYPIVKVNLPSPTPKLEITVQTFAEATNFINSLSSKSGKVASSSQNVDDLADLMAKVTTKTENKSIAPESAKQPTVSKASNISQPINKPQAFNRIIGTVLEWKADQHFGFINPKNPIGVANPKVFFHGSALKDFPGSIAKGDIVEFSTVEGNKGPGSFAAKGILKCIYTKRMEISVEALNSKPQQKTMAEIRVIHKNAKQMSFPSLSTSSPSILSSSPSIPPSTSSNATSKTSLSTSSPSIPTSTSDSSKPSPATSSKSSLSSSSSLSPLPSHSPVLLELFLDDKSFYILSNFECSMASGNEYLLVRCAAANPAQRSAGACAVCGLDTQPSATSGLFECKTCQIAQKLLSVRIYSISTSQHGREEDYAAILDLVSACGGQVAAPLVKTEMPKAEIAEPAKPARKSTKHVITAKDLADLMASLSFAAPQVKTDVVKKEIAAWLADGVSLKTHQIEAVAWMDEAEKGKFSGGILADDMGMGKTLTTIANILMHLEVDRKRQEKQKGLRGTLVVCKASILDQWMEEIRTRTSESGHIKSIIYHEKKGREIGKLQNADIVITTYGMVERDEGILFSEKSKWTRLILDEGHTIHNTDTIAAKKLRSAEATYRWILTGTPLQNSIFDLHALFYFLHISPYDNREIFKKLTKAWTDFVPVIKELLPRVLLRRTKKTKDEKGNPILDLPKKEVTWHNVGFDEREAAAYKILVDLLKNNLPQNSKATKSGNVLSLHGYILRLCNHLRLITHDHADKIFANVPIESTKRQPTKTDAAKSGKVKNFEKISAESTKNEFLKLLDFAPKEESDTEESEDEPSQNEDGLDSEDSDKENQDAQRKEKGKGKREESKDVDELLSSMKSLKIQKNKTTVEYQSSKVRELISTMKKLRKQDTTTKFLIFSQWTRMLDLLEGPLTHEDFSFVRLQGSMKSSQRYEAIRQFRDDPNINVFLLSLKAGGVGLNLTAANHVMMLDMWYNPAVEEQACDRVHRIGQTKPVFIHRFIVQDSVEEKLQKIQQSKKNLAESILGMDDKTLLSDSEPGNKKEMLQQLCNLLY